MIFPLCTTSRLGSESGRQGVIKRIGSWHECWFMWSLVEQCSRVFERYQVRERLRIDNEHSHCMCMPWHSPAPRVPLPNSTLMHGVSPRILLPIRQLSGGARSTTELAAPEHEVVWSFAVVSEITNSSIFWCVHLERHSPLHNTFPQNEHDEIQCADRERRHACTTLSALVSPSWPAPCNCLLRLFHGIDKQHADLESEAARCSTVIDGQAPREEPSINR